MKAIIIAQGQTIVDIALQYYGTAEAVMQIITDNPALTINSYLYPGDQVQIDDSLVLPVSQSKILDHYAAQQLSINTGLTSPPKSGIGWMTIETTFTVG